MKKLVSLASVIIIIAVSCVPAFAASFVSSVSSDGSPVFKSAFLMSADGDEIAGLDGISVTPYNNRRNAPNSGVREELENAEKDFRNNSLSELVSDLPEGLVLSEIFYINIPDECEDMRKSNDGSYFLITLETDKKYKTAPVTLYKNADGKWEILDIAVLNKNGTVKLTVSDGGAYAFLAEASVVIDDSDITSPKTGYAFAEYTVLFAGAAVLITAVGFSAKRKSGNV